MADHDQLAADASIQQRLDGEGPLDPMQLAADSFELELAADELQMFNNLASGLLDAPDPEGALHSPPLQAVEPAAQAHLNHGDCEGCRASR
jgi:hypothetical protein